MRRHFMIYGFFLFYFANIWGKDEAKPQSYWRLNIINPSLEYEFPIGESAVLSSALGWGYGYSYSFYDASSISGYIILLAPFAEVEYKYLYQLRRRHAEGKKTDGNSSDYFALRVLYRGEETYSNYVRRSSYDLGIGPTWGLQRSLNRLYFVLDVGLFYYFSDYDNGIVPSLKLGVGINLTK